MPELQGSSEKIVLNDRSCLLFDIMSMEESDAVPKNLPTNPQILDQNQTPTWASDFAVP